MKMDLTGQRFGKLTVTGEADSVRSSGGKMIRRWHCKCDCGREQILYQNTLTGKNGARSCGCSRGDALVVDMSGQRFGRLTVIKRVPLEHTLPNGQKTGWLCRCDCGKEKIATRKELMSGSLLSCGCLLSETARKKVNEDNVLGHYDGTAVSAIQPDRPPNKNNKSGVKGVYWNKSENRWIAKIGLRGKTITIGRYKSLEEAAAARRDAEKKYFAPVLEAYKAEATENSEKTEKQ